MLISGKEIHLLALKFKFKDDQFEIDKAWAKYSGRGYLDFPLPSLSCNVGETPGL